MIDAKPYIAEAERLNAYDIAPRDAVLAGTQRAFEIEVARLQAEREQIRSEAAKVGQENRRLGGEIARVRQVVQAVRNAAVIRNLAEELILRLDEADDPSLLEAGEALMTARTALQGAVTLLPEPKPHSSN